jgi:hypothetical protein
MKLQPFAPTLLALAVAVTSPICAAERANCPKTVPSGEILGEPFPDSEHWYGSETLAVMLRPDGIWRGMGPNTTTVTNSFGGVLVSSLALSLI